MRNLLIYVFLVSLACVARAQQEELEYQLELGGAAGACYYLGDVNNKPFWHTSGMMGVVARRVFNPRMVLKGNLAFGHLNGNSGSMFIPTDGSSETAEGGVPTYVKFKRNVIDLGAQFEFNFWGYGLGQSYKGNSRITPYAVLGAGFTLAPGGGDTRFALNFPVGFGVKYKVKPRVNVGAEWTVRFTTTDGLDITKSNKQLDDPYSMQSSGFKNKDCYSFFMLFMTYDMCPKYRKCNN